MKVLIGDAQEVLKTLDYPIHLVLTGPPFRFYCQSGVANELGIMEETAYEKAIAEVFAECARLLVPGGKFIAQAGDRYINGKRISFGFLFHLLLSDTGLEYVGRHYFCNMSTRTKRVRLGSYPNPVGIPVPYMVEEMLVFKKAGKRTNNGTLLEKDIVRLLHEPLWQFYHKPLGNEIDLPLELVKRLLLLHSYKDDIVLDPFCGSGTTLQACHETDREAIGIDITEKYLKDELWKYCSISTL